MLKWGSNFCVGVHNLFISFKFILEKTLTLKYGFLESNCKFYCISFCKKKLVIISKLLLAKAATITILWLHGLLMQRRHTYFFLACKSLLVYDFIPSSEMFFQMLKTTEFWEIVCSLFLTFLYFCRYKSSLNNLFTKQYINIIWYSWSHLPKTLISQI